MSFFFFFKQKTAYEMRISDWSSDVCSSDLAIASDRRRSDRSASPSGAMGSSVATRSRILSRITANTTQFGPPRAAPYSAGAVCRVEPAVLVVLVVEPLSFGAGASRSEEHTSELQSLMRISYAVFCLKKKHSKIR